MKPCVRGKSIFFREVAVSDAEFIVELRTDPKKNKHLSVTSNDIIKQENFISLYLENQTDFYFIINDWNYKKLGTIRIYDIRNNSFCWGSWIISDEACKSAAIESALMIYDYAFYSLHYLKSHFDVRKDNLRVVDFHKRFGAKIVGNDDLNYYFEYGVDDYAEIRKKYRRYLP
jgi:RimJ/RimL family protein N-acetyltransferase